MGDAAHVIPEIFAEGNGRRLQAFQRLLLDLFLLTVAADEVADEFAGGGIGTALDAGFRRRRGGIRGARCSCWIAAAWIRLGVVQH